MFLARTLHHRGVIEVNCGMSDLLTFKRKNFFLSLFGYLRIKWHFHWYAQLKILIKSSFSCDDDRLVSWTTKKIEVSSAKSLAGKNNRSPKIDPWGTPASTGDHERWLIIYQNSLNSLWKLSTHFSGRLDILKDYSL